MALQLLLPGTQISWHSCSDAPPSPVREQPVIVQSVQSASHAPLGAVSDGVGAALGDGPSLGRAVGSADVVADDVSVPAGGALRANTYAFAPPPG
jgi:hypothetical protein